MAEIRVGRHVLESDTHGWSVSTEEVKDGKTRRRNHKYAGTLPGAVSLLMELRLRESDAETLEGLVAEVHKIRSELAALFTLKVSL